MMSSMMQPDMNSLLRFFIVALVVFVSVVAFSFCADALCSACTDVCCGGADRAKPLARLTRALTGACKSAVSFTLPLSVDAAMSWAQVLASPAPAPLPAVSALRI
jgi:hypothetical protein